MAAPRAEALHAGIQTNAEGRHAPIPPELKAEIRRLLAAALVADVRAGRAAQDQQDEDERS